MFLGNTHKISMIASKANISSLSYVASTSIDRTDSSSDFTFSNVSIGSANSNRIVIIGVAACRGAGSVIPLGSISSVTVGGNSATQLASIFNVGNNAALYIYAIALSTGTTANIVVSHGLATTCGIATYSMISKSLTLTPNSTGSAQRTQTFGSGTISTTVSRVVDSAIVGFVYGINNGATTFTGLTENFDFDTRSTENFAGAFLYPSTSSNNLTVTATCNNQGLLLVAVWN